jgi:hypothetical protein
MEPQVVVPFRESEQNGAGVPPSEWIREALLRGGTDEAAAPLGKVRALPDLTLSDVNLDHGV